MLKIDIKKIVPFLFILSALIVAVYFVYNSHDGVDCKSVLVYKTKLIKASEVDDIRFNMLGLYGSNVQEYANVTRQSLLMHIDDYHITVISQFHLVVPFNKFDKNIFLMKQHNANEKLNEIYGMQLQSQSTICSNKPSGTHMVLFLTLIGVSFILLFRAFFFRSKLPEND